MYQLKHQTRLVTGNYSKISYNVMALAGELTKQFNQSCRQNYMTTHYVEQNCNDDDDDVH